MYRYLVALLALNMVVLSNALAAETAYVIDKLLVGVHQDEDLNSAIVKVLPTGTKLEVLSRKGEIAKIKDPDGVTGWVDAAYLMKTEPAADAVEQLKLDKQALADRVKTLEANKATPGGPPGAVDGLTNENTELKSQLSAQKLKNSELEATISELQKNAQGSASSGTVVSELQAANLELRKKLDLAQESLEALGAKNPGATVLEKVRSATSAGSSTLAIGFGILLLAAFGGGVYLMDYLNRRRHGGFRV